MVYCQKCGTKNEEDAEFCKKCSTSLKTTEPIRKKDHEDKCEEECAVGKQSPYQNLFWGIIVILVGLWIIFSLILPETEFGQNLPSWLVNFQFWWLIGLIIAIAIIVTGLRIIFSRK